MSDLGGGYIGVHVFLSPFVYLKFHNENNFKKKNNTANLQLNWRVIAWDLNVFVFTGRYQCKKWIVWLITLFGLTHQGFLDKIVEDCDKVLSLNASNCKALYRKSKALSDLGRYKEAYDAVAKCSLAVPQVWDLYFCLFVYIMTILLLFLWVYGI